MTAAPLVQPRIPRPTKLRRQRIGDVEPLGRNAARSVVAVESHLFDARTELVYQEDDLIEAASPENNALLERALRVEGLPPLARELIRAALFIEAAEDAAARRAERRRLAASDSQRAAIGGCEALLTRGEGV